MKIKLPITLTPKQKEVNASGARFKVLKVGRRGAKTYYIAFWLAVQALTRPGKHWYVTKVLSLAREELWPILLNLLPRDRVSKIDERSLSVWLTNGSVISCKSSEKEDNLRGRGLMSVVLDEAAFCRSTVWDRILRPQLAVSRGPAILASSPKKGWFTQLYNDIVNNPHPDWAAFHWTIYDNPHVPPDEIEVIKAKTPLNTWLQEYMAEEVAEAGQVYDEFNHSRSIFNPSEKFLDAKEWKCIRGLDWGRADDTGAVWVCISPDGYLVITDEHVQDRWDPARQAEAILSKSSGYKIHASVLDKTAFREESTGLSVADQFRDSGLRCQPSEGNIDASVNIVKRFMRGDSRAPWLYISARCGKLITALQEWEHGDHEPDVAAAMRYAVTWAVSKRLTQLSDAVPALQADKTVSEERAKYILAAEARIVPTIKRRSWAWDHSAGVPN